MKTELSKIINDAIAAAADLMQDISDKKDEKYKLLEKEKNQYKKMYFDYSQMCLKLIEESNIKNLNPSLYWEYKKLRVSYETGNS